MIFPATETNLPYVPMDRVSRSTPVHGIIRLTAVVSEPTELSGRHFHAFLFSLLNLLLPVTFSGFPRESGDKGRRQTGCVVGGSG